MSDASEKTVVRIEADSVFWVSGPKFRRCDVRGAPTPQDGSIDDSYRAFPSESHARAFAKRRGWVVEESR